MITEGSLPQNVLGGWSHTELGLSTPLTSLPAEIRSKIYDYAIRIPQLHAMGKSDAGPPYIFLASRAFYAEARGHCFHDRTFNISLTGSYTSRLDGYEQDESAHRSRKNLHIVVLKARHLHLEVTVHDSGRQYPNSESAMFRCIRAIFGRREQPVASLRMEFVQGPDTSSWRYPEQWPVDDGTTTLPGDWLLEAVQAIRRAEYQVRYDTEGKRAIFSRAEKARLQASYTSRPVENRDVEGFRTSIQPPVGVATLFAYSAEDTVTLDEVVRFYWTGILA